MASGFAWIAIGACLRKQKPIRNTTAAIRKIASASPAMMGNQRPRLFSAPPGNYPTKGTEATELAKSAGLFLDPWQSWCLDEMLAVRPGGKWLCFENCIIVCRQDGKGAILEARELAGLFLFRERLIIHTAHEFKTSEEAFLRIKFLIDNTDELYKRVLSMPTAHGQEAIILKPTPTLITGSDGKNITRSITQRLRFIARSKGSGRGFTGDCLVYDEAMILDASKVGATLPTLSARPNPQVIYTASAGLAVSTQLAKVRRRGIAGGARALFFGEWSILPHDEYCEPDCTKHDDPDAIESWAKANPGLGYRITAEHIANEREAMDEVEFARERLGVGQYPAPLDGWLVIPRHWWDATCDRNVPLPRVINPVFAIDVSPDRAHASIGVAGKRPDGRTGVELVERHGGTKWLVARATELHNEWHPAQWVIDSRSAAASLTDKLEKAGLPVTLMTTRDVAHACGQFFDAVRDDELAHGPDTILNTALAGADKRPLSEAWAWDRRNVGVDISPLVAVTFALWGYAMFGEASDYDIKKSVHFDTDEVIRLIRAGAYGLSDLERLRASEILSDKDLAIIRDALT